MPRSHWNSLGSQAYKNERKEEMWQRVLKTIIRELDTLGHILVRALANRSWMRTGMRKKFTGLWPIARMKESLIQDTFTSDFSISREHFLITFEKRLRHVSRLGYDYLIIRMNVGYETPSHGQHRSYKRMNHWMFADQRFYFFIFNVCSNCYHRWASLLISRTVIS